jgi:hypothetical protein
MPRLFHVSSAANRKSILAHGLDWTRMGAARGIAGSTTPEQEGVFLCRDGGSGFGYFPSPVPPAQVTLADWPQDEAVPATRGGQRGKRKQNRKKPRAGK